MEADGDVGIVVEMVVEIFYREGGKACEGDGADEDDVSVRMIAVDGEGDDKAGILDFGYLFIEQHVLVVLAIEVDEGDKNYDDENTLDDSRDNSGC